MSFHAILDFVLAHRLAAMSLVPVLLLVVWLFNRNEDLQPHRVRLAIAFALLGMIPLIWLISSHTKNLPAGILISVFLGFVILRHLVKTIDRATNDFLGGLLFDLIFSEGPFAAIYRSPKKLPSLKLLQAWRASGLTRKAYRAARRSLVKTEDAFPLWLFAAETAAIHLGKVPTAIRIIRRLCLSKQFTDDQKAFALNHLKGWAAAKGYDLNVLKMKQSYGPPPKPAPLGDINRLRSRGCYQEAKSQLLDLLRRDPENMAAAVLLVRVYAQDLHQRDKAVHLINAIEKKPFASSSVVAFLRNSLNEWLTTPPPRSPVGIRLAPKTPKRGPKAESLKRWLAKALGRNGLQSSPASQPRPQQARKNLQSAFIENLSPQVAGLVTEGLLGTAVETLKSLIQQKPADFDLQLQLAQVWVLYCDYPRGAERIIATIEGDPRFTAAQKSTAKAQLALWRKKPAEQNPTKPDRALEPVPPRNSRPVTNSAPAERTTTLVQ
jgi:hypothetical protein